MSAAVTARTETTSAPVEAHAVGQNLWEAYYLDRATSLTEALEIAEAEGFEPLLIRTGQEHYFDPREEINAPAWIIAVRPRVVWSSYGHARKAVEGSGLPLWDWGHDPETGERRDTREVLDQLAYYLFGRQRMLDTRSLGDFIRSIGDHPDKYGVPVDWVRSMARDRDGNVIFRVPGRSWADGRYDCEAKPLWFAIEDDDETDPEALPWLNVDPEDVQDV